MRNFTDIFVKIEPFLFIYESEAPVLTSHQEISLSSLNTFPSVITPFPYTSNICRCKGCFFLNLVLIMATLFLMNVNLTTDLWSVGFTLLA